jgi:hypothetical protein
MITDAGKSDTVSSSFMTESQPVSNFFHYVLMYFTYSLLTL